MRKLNSPLLIFSVFLLIVNDWILKEQFHNYLTGKLSDFAGLFAFAFVFSSLFPKWTKTIHVTTAIGFLYWKSPYSQPLLDILNELGVPSDRTVDYTDYMALAILPVSFNLVKQEIDKTYSLFLSKTVLLISSLSFMATTLPTKEIQRVQNINKIYYCHCSKEALLKSYNEAQLRYMLKNAHYGMKFNDNGNMFHSDSYRYYKDTIMDTLAIMTDFRRHEVIDSVQLKTSFAVVQIAGTEDLSTIKVIQLGKFVVAGNKKDLRQKLIKQFERQIISRLPCHRK